MNEFGSSSCTYSNIVYELSDAITHIRVKLRIFLWEVRHTATGRWINRNPSEATLVFFNKPPLIPLMWCRNVWLNTTQVKNTFKEQRIIWCMTHLESICNWVWISLYTKPPPTNPHKSHTRWQRPPIYHHRTPHTLSIANSLAVSGTSHLHT